MQCPLCWLSGKAGALWRHFARRRRTRRSIAAINAFNALGIELSMGGFRSHLMILMDKMRDHATVIATLDEPGVAFPERVRQSALNTFREAIAVFEDLGDDMDSHEQALNMLEDRKASISRVPDNQATRLERRMLERLN